MISKFQRRILVLNLIPNTIGDSLSLTPLFTVLKHSFPDAYLATTATSTNAELYKHNQFLDEVILIERIAKIGDTGAGRFSKLITYLRVIAEAVRALRGKFDTILVPPPNFFLSHAIPRLAGAQKRIGYSFKGAHLSFLLTDKVVFTDPIKNPTRNFADTILDLAIKLGCRVRKEDLHTVYMVSSDEEKWVKEFLTGQGIRDYITIQAGAKWVSKCWPKEYFAQLIHQILGRYNDLSILLLGSTAEHEYNESIRTATDTKRVFNLCGSPVPLNAAGQPSIRHVAALLAGAKLHVGNDSGLMHVASAVGTPVAIFYATTSISHSRPRGKGLFIPIIAPGNTAKELFINSKSAGVLDLMRAIRPVVAYNKVSPILSKSARSARIRVVVRRQSV